ncbi:hypothetical protein V6465_003476 [Vibrio cholerae]
MIFDNLEEVPLAIRAFYKIEHESIAKVDENGSPVFTDSSFTWTDENGVEQTSLERIQVFEEVDVVCEINRSEIKGWDDVELVITKHKGERDDLIALFVDLASSAEQWQFHDEYLAWLNNKPSIQSIDVDEGDSEQDALEKAIALWESYEPKPKPLMTWESYKAIHWERLRQAAYLPLEKQLELMNDDARLGTKTWFEHQDKVKSQYPKPL